MGWLWGLHGPIRSRKTRYCWRLAIRSSAARMGRLIPKTLQGSGSDRAGWQGHLRNRFLMVQVEAIDMAYSGIAEFARGTLQTDDITCLALYKNIAFVSKLCGTNQLHRTLSYLLTLSLRGEGTFRGNYAHL